MSILFSEMGSSGELPGGMGAGSQLTGKSRQEPATYATYTQLTSQSAKERAELLVVSKG
jgi:hypothetical protein